MILERIHRVLILSILTQFYNQKGDSPLFVLTNLFSLYSQMGDFINLTLRKLRIKGTVPFLVL